ncbi:hypothetical protein IJG90_02950 [Candidatus Saccharibacteria bacterium]|nr:hypothetical protein [Candidatus Saccharibacteria bacterium]
MKRVQKNILGLSGLAVVAAMTAVAVAIPGPEALAVSTVTDTINVRVVDYMPSVVIGSTAGVNVANPTYPYAVDYSHANRLTISITYINGDTTKTIVLEDIKNMGDATGSQDFSVKVTDLVFPDEQRVRYGTYKITAKVVSEDGTPVENYLTFNYVPATGNINGDEVTISDLDNDVERVEIRTRAGKIVGAATREQLEQNNMKIKLNLDDVGCQEQLYLYAYVNDELVSVEPYEMTTECIPVPDAGAPDTGGLFQNLNISKEDYLITGLIVFFVLGIVGFGVVMRKDHATTRKRRK